MSTHKGPPLTAAEIRELGDLIGELERGGLSDDARGRLVALLKRPVKAPDGVYMYGNPVGE